jgi:hypothetical protein
VVHQHLARHHTVQVVETNRRGHATRFAEDAAFGQAFARATLGALARPVVRVDLAAGALSY